MEIRELKDLTHGISTRDHGFEVFQKVLLILQQVDVKKAVKEQIKKDGEFKSGLIKFDKSAVKTIDVGIKLLNETYPKFSFLDELINQLKEHNLLHRVMFFVENISTIENLKTISHNRKLTINAEIDNRFIEIDPTMKETIEEPEVIYEDL